MKPEKLIRYIPSWPRGCSLELLAVKGKYIKNTSSKAEYRKGMKQLRKDLAWATIRNVTIVERELPLQLSTKQALKEYGVDMEDRETTVYISKDRKGCQN